MQFKSATFLAMPAFLTLGSAYNVVEALEASKAVTLARAPEAPANIRAAEVDVRK